MFAKKIKIVIDEGGMMPTMAHDTDCAYDLYVPMSGTETKPLTIRSHDSMKVPLKIHVKLGKRYGGIITHRSGLNIKGCWAYGLVDGGYTGEISINVYNTGDDPIVLWPGDRIGQMRIVRCPRTKMKAVKSLGKTDRGNRGFGSTGR